MVEDWVESRINGLSRMRREYLLIKGKKINEIINFKSSFEYSSTDD